MHPNIAHPAARSREGLVFLDAFVRVRDLAHRSIGSLSTSELGLSPAAGANPAGWLVWHLTRVQDRDVLLPLRGRQVWDSTWQQALGIGRGANEDGRGDGPTEVARLRSTSGAAGLLDYHDSVAAQVGSTLAAVDAEGWDQIVDTSYDPPVTLRTRVVSVCADSLQHVGQAMYLQGLIARRAGREFVW